MFSSFDNKSRRNLFNFLQQQVRDYHFIKEKQCCSRNGFYTHTPSKSISITNKIKKQVVLKKVGKSCLKISKRAGKSYHKIFQKGRKKLSLSVSAQFCILLFAFPYFCILYCTFECFCALSHAF